MQESKGRRKREKEAEIGGNSMGKEELKRARDSEIS